MKYHGRKHEDHDHVVDEHRDETREHADEGHEGRDVPLRQLQHDGREKVGHPRLAEVAGYDPDTEQDQDHVPIDDLEGLHIRHDTEEDHDEHAAEGGDHAVDPAGDDKNDRDEKDGAGCNLNEFHKDSLCRAPVRIRRGGKNMHMASVRCERLFRPWILCCPGGKKLTSRPNVVKKKSEWRPLMMTPFEFYSPKRRNGCRVLADYVVT